MRKKIEPIPWYQKPVNPSPIISSVIIASAVAVAYNAVTAVSRWYDKVVPGFIEKAEIAKITADTVLGTDDDDE